MTRTELVVAIGCTIALSACTPVKNLHPDVHGHRGCRGLLPENSIPAFLKATEIGCDFLEMDVVMSKDGQVIVSHEPWMDHVICLAPDDVPISAADERSHNIYHMTVDEIRTYDCGSLEHPRFPDQDQRRGHKPTLREVIELVDEHAMLSSVVSPSFNIEIKSDPALYGTFQPTPTPFALAVLATIDSLGITDRCVLQSFDPAVLEALHTERSELQLALLVENNDGLKANLSRLSFKPAIYSPHFSQVDIKLLKALRLEDIELVVWTVNEKKDILRMIDLGVDGIISDRPDRVLALIEDR